MSVDQEDGILYTSIFMNTNNLLCRHHGHSKQIYIATQKCYLGHHIHVILTVNKCIARVLFWFGWKRANEFQMGAFKGIAPPLSGKHHLFFYRTIEGVWLSWIVVHQAMARDVNRLNRWWRRTLFKSNSNLPQSVTLSILQHDASFRNVQHLFLGAIGRNKAPCSHSGGSTVPKRKQPTLTQFTWGRPRE